MVRIIEGGMYTDERGVVAFVNGFNFKDIKRFYVVYNHNKGYFRGWHGHKHEEKYIHVVSGSARIGVVNIETNEMHSFLLEARTPKIIYVPPGHANGFLSLTDDTKVIFFSNMTLEESQADITRFPPDTWCMQDKA